MAAIIVEVALERRHGAVGDQPQPVRHQVDQMGIVADQHDGAGVVVDRLHQRLTGVDVEVVGRLVQDQNVRPGIAHQRQQQPRLFAAGKRLDGDVRLVLDQAELAEPGADRRLLRLRQRLAHHLEGGLPGG